MRAQRRFAKRRIAWALALACLGIWLAVATPGVVRAHALLVRSLPEANAELAQPPTTIELWFSEPLEAGFSRARLLNSRGEEVPTGAASLDPSDATHMSLPLGQLGPGVYTVAWQTLSAVDGHEWYGSFPFTVLNPDGSRPGGEAAAVGGGQRGELPSAGEVASRWLALLGGALFFGTSLFQTIVVPASRQADATHPARLAAHARDLALRAVWVAVLAVALGSWLQIVLQALRLGGPGQ